MDVEGDAIIHPMWPIEEYAKIDRNWVWFSPPNPPVNLPTALIDKRRGV